MSHEIIPVCKPFLPPMEEVTTILQEVWDSGILTHNGPKVVELEKRLSTALGTGESALVVNGTLGLELILEALEIDPNSEIITTPFTWIATASSIMWKKFTPRFVDINPKTFNLDPTQIEDSINSKTKAILAVHVFSSPADIQSIENIGKKYGIYTIYDAAHAFGVKYKGESVLNYGDASMVSLHATKIFNSGEGGAIFGNHRIVQKCKQLRFFGFDENKEIKCVGTNAKMTEIHASLGLINLDFVDEVMNQRKKDYQFYVDRLSSNKKITFQHFDEAEYNYSYMPIVLQNEDDVLNIMKNLWANKIMARRYFYPSLDLVQLYEDYGRCPNSNKLSKKILCLPNFFGLRREDIERICKIIKETI